MGQVSAKLRRNTDGMVQFLGDCSHALAGQTLPLPDMPPEYRDG